MSFKRYEKQMQLPNFGEKGQKKLKKSKVVIIGCGGLGSIAASYIVGAGVGKVILVDGDNIHPTNLHRQVFFDEESRLNKSDELKVRLSKLNTEIEIKSISEEASEENIYKIIDLADIVLDCTDNIESKYIINNACNKKGIPLSFGAIGGTIGYLSFFKNKENTDINLEDIYPKGMDLPPNTTEGVLNTTPGIIGLLQANKCIKYILGYKIGLNNELMIYNTLELSQTKFKIKKVEK